MKLQRHIRLDFTPLVDIAMILVLAYMVILYHQKAKVLSMILPHPSCINDGFVQMCNPENTATTLYLFENHVYYSNGYDEENSIYRTDYSLENFRKIVGFRKKIGPKILVIKPRDSSTYGDLVTIVSHCQRFKIRYALVPALSQNEETALSQAEQMFTKSLVVSR